MHDKHFGKKDNIEPFSYGKNIALIGMPGTFKTTVGKILAKASGFDFYDTDAMIVKKFGQSIPEIFEKHGEEAFRERETIISYDAAQKRNAIIATGGGIVVRQENIDALKQSSVIIQLCAHVYTIFARIRNSKTRPLLANLTIEKLSSMFQARGHLYSAAADIKVTTDGKLPRHIAEFIVKKLNENK